jgi:hypothetical protein
LTRAVALRSEAFDLFDTDGSGTIDAKELKVAMRCARRPLAPLRLTHDGAVALRAARWQLGAAPQPARRGSERRAPKRECKFPLCSAAAALRWLLCGPRQRSRAACRAGRAAGCRVGSAHACGVALARGRCATRARVGVAV